MPGKKFILLSLALLLLSSVPLAHAAPQAASLARSVIGSASAQLVSNSSYQVNSIVGQSITGPAANVAYHLQSGYPLGSEAASAPACQVFLPFVKR